MSNSDLKATAKQAIGLFCALVCKLTKNDYRRALANLPPLLLTRAEAWPPCWECGSRFDGLTSRSALCADCFWRPLAPSRASGGWYNFSTHGESRTFYYEGAPGDEVRIEAFPAGRWLPVQTVEPAAPPKKEGWILDWSLNPPSHYEPRWKVRRWHRRMVAVARRILTRARRHAERHGWRGADIEATADRGGAWSARIEHQNGVQKLEFAPFSGVRKSWECPTTPGLCPMCFPRRRR